MSKYNCKINPKEDYEYQTIDYNWAKKPIAFCHYYHGYLTEKQIKIHKCEYKKYGFCHQLEPLIDDEYFNENYGDKLKEKINYYDSNSNTDSI